MGITLEFISGKAKGNKIVKKFRVIGVPYTESIDLLDQIFYLIDDEIFDSNSNPVKSEWFTEQFKTEVARIGG